MSLLLREELRVVLSPQQVLLVRIGLEINRRGLAHRVLEKKAVPCAGGGDVPWSAAVETLAAELPGMADTTVCATVILSNHFMRYALVPWSAALRDDAEEEAFARHFFRQLYGSVAESWELRVNPERPGAPRLASAVDGRLTEAVRGLFAESGIRLCSLQPSLMAACNSCRDRLQGRSAWFVLFEAGSLCLALLQQGKWSSVRTLRAGADWRDSLPLTLEREAYLAEGDAAADEILLWAPEIEEPVLPEGARWKVHVLQPVIRPELVPDYDRRFAVAMGG